MEPSQTDLSKLSNILGICIPTYNRANYLKFCLESLIGEVSSFGLPIFISDNASTDETTSTVLHIKERYSRIFYRKNDLNIGIYRNILQVMEMSNTDYIWIMGDDDAIVKGKLDILMEKINFGWDYIILNSIPYDVNMERKRENKIIKCESNIEYRKGEAEKLLVDLKKWAYHGYISSMVVKLDLLVPLIEKYKSKKHVLYDNVWFPLSMFYEAILSCNGIFICDPIVMNRDNPRNDQKIYWEHFFIDRVKALQYLNNVGYSNKSLRLALNTNIIGTAYISILSKYFEFNKRIFSNFLKRSKLIPMPSKIIVLTIDYIPTSAISFLYLTIQKMKKN